MKFKIFIALILIAAMSGCKKTDTVCTEPVSSFKVSNQSNHTIFEGKILELVNQSTNATSYHWDFGNGITSDKATPAFYYTLHGEYTITLTVTDAKGKISKSSYSITVLCSIMNPNHTPLTAPVI